MARKPPGRTRSRKGRPAAVREQLEPFAKDFPGQELDLMAELFLRSSAYQWYLGHPHDWKLRDVFDRWIHVDVLMTDVTFLAPGWFGLSHPWADHRVEMYWESEDRPGDYPDVVVKRFNILGEDVGLRFDMSPYLAAAALDWMRKPRAFGRPPRRRPAAGRPKDVGWYRDLIDAHKRLRLDGYRNAATVLAERMGENPSTVRSWLRRGRIYLREEMVINAPNEASPWNP